MDECTISGQIAKFCVGVKYEDIPPAIVEKTKRHILDTLGAGIAGSLSDEHDKLTKVFNLLGRKAGSAPLWGTGRFSDPLDATLANGMACHTFELDDTGGCDHSGAVVLPAALACLPLCERAVSGREFITAVVLGYDIARRALEACGAYESHNEAGWHSTSTCGSFGAAAAAGYLLKLSKEQMQSALGLASSSAGGLWAFIHDGAQNKRLHPGRAAEGGLLAVLLAREGFRGATMIFEDVWGGFTKTFAPLSEDPAAWTKELGVDWKIGRVSIKPHTSCRSTHAAIDAAEIMMKRHNWKSTDIKEIIVELNPFVQGMCGGRDTATLPGTQMSLPYGIAAMVAYGSAGLGSYTEKMRSSDKVHKEMDKVKLVVNACMPSDEEPSVTIVTNSGMRDQVKVEIPRGSPANPVEDNELLTKYRSVAAMIWKEEIIDKLPKLILALEAVSDINEISHILGAVPLKRDIIR